MRSLRYLTLCLILATPSALAAQTVADIHLHYKWSQAEVTSPAEAVAALERNHVRLAVVIGTPPELALRLSEVPSEMVNVMPIFGPYRRSGDWDRWYRDPTLLDRAREGLASGRYHGIGELHLISGFAPDWRTPVISGLAALGAEFDVPLLVHTEASRPDYLIEFCQANPKTRFLWAHAGAILPPEQVARTLDACPNLWVELSARDSWRYTASPITDESGRLLPEWDALVRTYVSRFMIGSDAVWPVEQLDPWDESDTGWEHIDRFLDFHRRWLAALPPEMAKRIALSNAMEFFGLARP
jgi:hypothetical protein